MSPKRYAEGTAVQVSSSRGEITGILASHGCQRMAWGTAPEGDTLGFELSGKQFRFMITKPTVDDVKRMYREDGRDWSRVYDAQAKVEAEWRRRWRAHVLLIKAKLEFIDGGDTTLEREFLPYAVLQDGRTVGQLMDGGGLPLLMSGAER
jgi:hypothetical protein